MWSVGLLVVATVDGRLCLLLQFHHGAGRMWSPFPRHVQHLLCCTDDGNMTARDVSRQSGWLEPLLCSRHSYQARQTHIHAVPWLHSSQTVTKPQGCLSFIMWHEHVSSCIYTTPLMQCLVSKHQGKWLEFRAAVFHQCKGESDIHFTFASTKCNIEKWSFISGDKVSLFSTGPWKLQSFWKTDFKKSFPSLLSVMYPYFCCNIYIFEYQKLWDYFSFIALIAATAPVLIGVNLAWCCCKKPILDCPMELVIPTRMGNVMWPLIHDTSIYTYIYLLQFYRAVSYFFLPSS